MIYTQNSLKNDELLCYLALLFGKSKIYIKRLWPMVLNIH